MKTLLNIIVFICLTTPGFGAVIPASTSSRLLYASQVGAKLNSNVYTGGGSDDSKPLQYGLDLATNYLAYEFVVDGPALISTNLVIRSNTKLRFVSGGGLFMANNSGCWPLGNQQNTNYATTNIVIEGGFINCNGNAQSEYYNSGHQFSGDPGVWGLWLGGVDGAIVRDVTLMSAKAYNYLVTDSRHVFMQNIRVLYTNNCAVTNTFYGNDGLHLMCNVEDFRCDGLYVYQANDDAIALNCNETDYTLPVSDPRWTTNSGSISNVVIQNVFIDHCKNIGRLVTFFGHTNAYIYNLRILNYHGQASTSGLLCQNEQGGSAYQARDWIIDGLDVEVGSSFDGSGYPILKMDGMFIDQLTLNNIRLIDRVSVGIGLTAYISLSSACTNVAMNNVFIEGNANSAGVGDAAVSIIAAATETNAPLLSVNNMTVLKLAAAFDTVNGVSQTSPRGIVKVSNLQMSPGTVANSGGFTNFTLTGVQAPMNYTVNSNLTVGGTITGNLIGTLTNNTTGTAATPTLLQTNFLSGIYYTNLSGRFQKVSQTYILTQAAVNGTVGVNLVTGANGAAVGTFVTNCAGGQKTLSTSLATTNVVVLAVGVPNNTIFFFTNQLVGSGNASAPQAGTGQQITY